MILYCGSFRRIEESIFRERRVYYEDQTSDGSAVGRVDVDDPARDEHLRVCGDGNPRAAIF